MKSVIVIPARLNSTRLPRKLLLNETGKSLLRHTYESASKNRKAARVIVAADDPIIAAEVESFGGNVILTDPNHVCGTDRIAEVALKLIDCDLLINVQGDEPEVSADAIDLVIEILEQGTASGKANGGQSVVMSTLATPIRSRSQLEDPNCVKVVVDAGGRAMYFSRSPIPHPRAWDDSLLKDDPQCADGATQPANFLQHVGLYGYRRDFLLKIPSLPVPLTERIESLEQLRVLHSGFPIKVGIIDHPVAGIDTAEDYAAFVKRASNR